MERMVLSCFLKTPFLSVENIEEVDELLLNNSQDINDIADHIQERFYYRSYKYMNRKGFLSLDNGFGVTFIFRYYK